MKRTVKLNNTGLMMKATFEEEDINHIFIPLLSKWTALQKELNRRIILFFGAPPGAGKSTLSLFLELLSKENENLTDVQVIGMDGFHHYASYLKTHTEVRDGKTILLDEVKGAPETFDLNRMEEKLQEAKTKKELIWPAYSRTKHDVIDNAYTVNSDILLFEGNYLLMNQTEWKALRDTYSDFSMFLYADPETLKIRLISRKIGSGHTKEDAEAFYSFSDGVNVQTVLKDVGEADLYLKEENGRYIAVG